MKTLETERLILRNVTNDDKNDYFELISDEQTCLDDGAYHAYPSMDCENFVRDFKIIKEADEHYGIILKSENKFIGLVHIMKTYRGVKANEIGYSINKDYRRQGFAKEAVNEVMRDLAENQGVEMVVATAFDYNDASNNMLTSMGFIKEGIIHWNVNHPERGLIDSNRYYKMLKSEDEK